MTFTFFAIRRPRRAALALACGALGVLSLAIPARADPAVRLTPVGVTPHEFEVTPDGSHVIFQGFDPSDAGTGRHEIFTLPLADPSSLTRLSSVPGSNEVMRFLIAPDSKHVAFQSMDDQYLNLGTFGARTDASAPTTLLHSAPIYDDDYSQFPFGITTDSTRVLVAADQNRNLSYGLYSRPFEGGAPAVRLDEETGASKLSVRSFLPVGQRVVFSGQDGLYSNREEGGQPVRLFEGAGTQFGHLPIATPDQSRVVFRSPAADGSVPIYSVPTDGSAPAALLFKLDATPLPQDFRDASPIVTPDSRTVIVTTLGTIGRVYSIPADGSAPARQLPLAAPFGLDPTVSPDSSRLVYFSAGPNGYPQTLYSQAIQGGPPALLSTSSPPGQVLDYYSLSVSPDSRWVTYGPAAGGGLYKVPLDGSAPPERLTLPGHEDAVRYGRMSPDGRYVALFADLVPDRYSEPDAVFVAPIDGGPFRQVTNPLLPGDQLWSGRFVPGTDSFVYLVFTPSGGALYLSTVPEPAAPVVLALLACGTLVRRRRLAGP